MVLVMSVDPGFGGQRFIETSLAKVERARAFLPAAVALELDGGVTALNAGALVAAGANLLVAGSSVFGGQDIGESYAALAQAAGEAV
jgi:ribulose-phosphate 3-epimerase